MRIASLVLAAAVGLSLPAVGAAQPRTAAPASECAAMRALVGRTLGVTATVAPGEFNWSGSSSRSCRITARSTGARLGDNYGVVIDRIQRALTPSGWRRVNAEDAGGPIGEGRGYRKPGGRYVYVNVEWEPAASARCPEDEPISDCNVRPAQMLYTIQVDLAQGR